MLTNLNRRQFGALAAAGTAGLLSPSLYAQQQLDTATIVIGFPPGVTPDVLARKVGEQLSKGGYSRAVMVDNRTGAGGQLAVTAVKGAAGDGSSILLTGMANLALYPFTYKKLPYDPVADLTPVSKGATFDSAIGVGPAVPESVRTISDLMAWFKANPSKANMGSGATGSSLHFAVVMLARAAGVDVTHIGYRGSAPAITEMLGGNLPALCAPLGSFTTQPKLRVLATCGAKRSRFTPDVPTLAEQGYKDMVYEEWYGFYLPAKARPETVRRLNAALREALAAPEVKQMLDTFAMEVAPSSPEEMAATLKADMRRWEPIVKSIGFTADS